MRHRLAGVAIAERTCLTTAAAPGVLRDARGPTTNSPKIMPSMGHAFFCGRNLSSGSAGAFLRLCGIHLLPKSPPL